MICIISAAADWVQAGAAVAITFLTVWTLHVLRDYAADTKRIADISASQTERSQMPFLTVGWWEGVPNSGEGGWELQNQGVGAALCVRFSLHQPPAVDAWRSIADIGPGKGRRDFHNQIAQALQNQQGNHTFIIEYSSLSGQQYRTTVERLPNGELRTTFHRPESLV
ncbi:MAG TPA: hypothetical protein VGK22_21930 [Candidatus Angelobacter sp.]|jgi:hypothetical protein